VAVVYRISMTSESSVLVHKDVLPIVSPVLGGCFAIHSVIADHLQSKDSLMTVVVILPLQ